jgi:hypothetical protein
MNAWDESLSGDIKFGKFYMNIINHATCIIVIFHEDACERSGSPIKCVCFSITRPYLWTVETVCVKLDIF